MRSGKNFGLMRFKKVQKGFTLIELLVVIAILGVISAVAVPNILNFIGSGEEEAAREERHTLVTAFTSARYAETHDAGLSFTEHDTSGIIDPAAAVDEGDPAYYLVNPTKFEWKITVAAGVEPGDGNPLT